MTDTTTPFCTMRSKHPHSLFCVVVFIYCAFDTHLEFSCMENVAQDFPCVAAFLVRPSYYIMNPTRTARTNAHVSKAVVLPT